MSTVGAVDENDAFFLLISSDAGTWKNACSEVYRLLKEKLAIESVYRPLKSPVRGLSMLKVENRDHIPGIVGLLDEKSTVAWLSYCKKITPLEEMFQASEEIIVQRAKNRFLSSVFAGEKWKIEIKRRHSNISRRGIIEKIAKEIATGNPVDLEKPDKIIRIEIIGEEVGIAVMKPDQLFSSKK